MPVGRSEFMRKRSSTVLLAILMGASLLGGVLRQRADAQEPPRRTSGRITAVLELFTSQGCSSCPTADLILKDYSEHPGVLALSLPVDYWDYLGWRDTFASAANSERQRALARARGDGMIFTPQLVVNGVSYVNGNRRADIDATLAKVPNDALRLPLSLTSTGDKVLLEVGELLEPAAATTDKPMRDAAIWIGAVQSTAEVKVRGGENGGRKLNYTNVVRGLEKIGTWNNAAVTLAVDRARLVQKHADGCVALVQEGGTGRILAAALLSNC